MIANAFNAPRALQTYSKVSRLGVSTRQALSDSVCNIWLVGQHANVICDIVPDSTGGLVVELDRRHVLYWVLYGWNLGFIGVDTRRLITLTWDDYSCIAREEIQIEARQFMGS